MSAPALVVVKIGGSLFDLPDLGPRLRCWLKQWEGQAVLLVPGGGRLADDVRDLDRRHGLGEEVSHWLALGAMTLYAHFLAALVPGAEISSDPARAQQDHVLILDALEFIRRDEGRPGALPHSWQAASDAVAARVAVVAGAPRLVLLKSVDVPAEIGWEEAGRRGLVDGYFSAVLTPDLKVEAVNFRKPSP